MKKILIIFVCLLLFGWFIANVTVSCRLRLGNPPDGDEQTTGQEPI